METYLKKLTYLYSVQKYFERMLGAVTWRCLVNMSKDYTLIVYKVQLQSYFFQLKYLNRLRNNCMGKTSLVILYLKNFYNVENNLKNSSKIKHKVSVTSKTLYKHFKITSLKIMLCYLKSLCPF